MKKSARFLPLLLLSLLFGLCLLPMAYAADLYVSGDHSPVTLNSSGTYDSILVSGDLVSGDAELTITGTGTVINSTGLVPPHPSAGIIVQASSGDATLTVGNGGLLAVSKDLLIYAKSRDASVDMRAASTLLIEGGVQITSEGGDAKLVLGENSVLSADGTINVTGLDSRYTSGLNAASGTVKAGGFAVDSQYGPVTVNIDKLTITSNNLVQFTKDMGGASGGQPFSVHIGTLTIDVSSRIELAGTAAANVVIDQLVITDVFASSNYLDVVPASNGVSAGITIKNINAVIGRVNTDGIYGAATIDPGTPPTDPGGDDDNNTPTPPTTPGRYVPLTGYDTATKKYTYVIFGDFPQDYLGSTQPTTGASGVDWVVVNNPNSDNYPGVTTGYFSVDPVVWRVLEAPGADKAKPKALLFSERNLAANRFHSSEIRYEASDVRAFLVGNDGKGGIFANAAYFSTEERSAVVPETISNTTNGLFLLSLEQLRTTKFGFIDNANRVALNTGYTASFSERKAQGQSDRYWTYSYSVGTLPLIISDGYWYSTDENSLHGVRPASFVNLESIIFKSGFDLAKPTAEAGTLENPYVLYAASADVPAAGATASWSGNKVTITFSQPVMPAYVNTPNLTELAKKFTVTDSSGAVAVSGVAFENGLLVLTLARTPGASCRVAYANYAAKDTDGIGLLTDRQVVRSLPTLSVTGVEQVESSESFPSAPLGWGAKVKLSENTNELNVTIGVSDEVRGANKRATFNLSDMAATESIARVEAAVSKLSDVTAEITTDEMGRLNLLITGTAPDIETVLAATVTRVSYWLTGDEATEYRQDFSPPLALADMNIELPEEDGGGSSSGCGNTGVGTPLAFALAIGLILCTRKTRAASGRP